jgi:hypothetical protein
MIQFLNSTSNHNWWNVLRGCLVIISLYHPLSTLNASNNYILLFFGAYPMEQLTESYLYRCGGQYKGFLNLSLSSSGKSHSTLRDFWLDELQKPDIWIHLTEIASMEKNKWTSSIPQPSPSFFKANKHHYIGPPAPHSTCFAGSSPCTSSERNPSLPTWAVLLKSDPTSHSPLVVDETPLKNDGQIVSWDDEISNMMGKIIHSCSKPPTSPLCLTS